ncbi:MAG: hypothetical protein CSB16_02450 [Clostridiales bacterium]|nr:MAG: hypothetical protein CSB16_02450 [Clostridiales bacterium]
MKLLENLRKQGVDEKLLLKVIEYRESKGANNDLDLELIYYGKDTWEMAISAILSGQNILLTGVKATGKNVFATNLAELFGRPLFETSFHINTDSDSLIGENTLTDGNVVFKEGIIIEAARKGAFLVLDEINMARNEAMAVLFSLLDFRKTVDVAGYDKVELNEDTRIIATMNYGYEGTKELNEALVSRFAVINMATMDREIFTKIVGDTFPKLNKKYLDILSNLYSDLQVKVDKMEISSKALDFRGFLGAIKCIEVGLNPLTSFTMFVTNKAFIDYEQEIIDDVIRLHIKGDLKAGDFFLGAINE